jgi:squalene-hopene/tetraprenyl-beta-curcumene cyclase
MTQTASARPAQGSAPVQDALVAAVAYLRGLQDVQGWWKGELATNVTMDAEDLLLREFLGIRTEEETREAARWIRSQQRADGTWATFHSGPPELSTTVEAWVALRLAGDPLDAPHMARATEWIRGNGGVESTRVFTRIWLALFGLWSWDALPHMPPEMIFLPSWFPLNVYDWACWARQTVVPLTIVNALRPVRPLPFGIDEIRVGPRRGTRPKGWSAFFTRLDKVLHLYGRHPIGPLRRLAMRRGAEWILARQEADGGWGGIQPPWVYSLLALHLLGYSLEHPALRAALAGLDGFLVRDKAEDGEIVRRLEACQSPVWDTGLALIALRDAGVPGDDDAVLRATRWLVREEIRVTGDWAVRRPDLAPGGWAFEFANDVYPDVDDTAEVVMALRHAAPPDPEERAAVAAAIERGIAWATGMQSKDGGWGAFDADNTSTLPMKLPFCDFGAVIDPPSADVTAHMLEMLATEGRAQPEPGFGEGEHAQRGGAGLQTAAKRGLAWLLANQEADGSWFGRWGANHVYGTGAAVPALTAAGVPREAEPIRRAVAWLARHQNEDGGWGEDLRSYVDPEWIGRGVSTASQTAWALLALLAAGERSATVERGVDFLVRTQRPDGGWDEDHFTGTGFPGDFYINYHLYRIVFPISALGRYARGEQS